jgi:mannose-6-phosphate isomerase-like protein (cupin superfamily)
MNTLDNSRNSRLRTQDFGLKTTLLASALALTAVFAAEQAQPGGSVPLAARVRSAEQVTADTSPWGTLRWLVNGKLDPGSGLTIGVTELNVGKSNPLHVHTNSDEVIYVLSGKCEQRVGKEIVILKAGDALRVPAGVAHQAKVLGNEPFRSIVAYNTGDRTFTVVTDN